MENCLVVVLCVCLAGLAVGFPQADLEPSRTLEDQQEQRLAIDMSNVAAQPKSPVLVRSTAEYENVEPSDLAKQPLKEDSKMKIEEKRLPGDDQYKMPQSMSADNLGISETEDNIRAKKSTSVQDIPRNHVPHTTTVCIQVRSEHQPQVVCGDPLSDNTKETDKGNLPKARFAYPSPNDYYPHTYDQKPLYLPSPLPGFFKASPPSMQDMKSQPNQVLPSKMGPNQIPGANLSPMSSRPSAARGALPVSMYPSRRSEEELVGPKIGDATLPGAGPVPSHLPQPQQGIIPHPNSIVVHKQYYPAPYQGFFPPHPPSPLRLNCAPEGFVPYMRNGPLPDGYTPYLRNELSNSLQPIEERIVLNGAVPRMAEISQYMDDQQAYFMDSQARQASQDSILGSPFASPDGLSGTLFIDENGQTYMMGDSQARSAGDEQRMWAQDQYVGVELKDNKVESSRRQEEELKRATEKLQDLEKQLEIIKKKTVVIDTDKKDAKKDQPDVSKEPEGDAAPPPTEKKIDPPKSAKRHTFRMGVV